MNETFFRQLPSSPYARTSGGAMERIVAGIMGLMVWATLAFMGLIVAASLLIWVAVAIVFSLISSLFTGRPATVTLLWRRYRDMTRQRWPARNASSNAPRADATAAAGAAKPLSRVEDVAWREVPSANDTSSTKR